MALRCGEYIKVGLYAEVVEPSLKTRQDCCCWRRANERRDKRLIVAMVASFCEKLMERMSDAKIKSNPLEVS